MRWRILFTLIVLLSVAGCRGTRSSDVWQSVLDAEKRALEDRAYELEREVATLEDQLASTRRENDALRNELDQQDTSRSSLGPPRGSRSQTGGEPDMVPDDLDAPLIELNESSPAEQLPLGGPELLNASTGSSSANRAPAKNDSRVAAQEASTSLRALGNLGALGGSKPVAEADDRVVSIKLNDMLTGGDDHDNRPGDEGLSVVIEPQNIDGVYVPQAGSVSVVLLDPAKQGSSARVARWDFDIGEAEARLKQSALGRGIHLNLPWPNKPPENTRLHLFVRYTSADQRRLETDREIRIDLQGRISARWTPASTGSLARQQPTPASPSPEIPTPEITVQQQPSVAKAASPYANRVEGPPVGNTPAETGAVEKHRIEVAERPDTEQPPASAEQTKKKLKRPQWKPFR